MYDSVTIERSTDGLFYYAEVWNEWLGEMTESQRSAWTMTTNLESLDTSFAYLWEAA